MRIRAGLGGVLCSSPGFFGGALYLVGGPGVGELGVANSFANGLFDFTLELIDFSFCGITIHRRTPVVLYCWDPDRSQLRLSPGKKCLYRPSARNQVEDDADDDEDKEEMNPGPDGVYAYYSEQPQYKQNDGDSPKHFSSPETCTAMSSATGLCITNCGPSMW
jgi:hypothetical protein